MWLYISFQCKVKKEATMNQVNAVQLFWKIITKGFTNMFCFDIFNRNYLLFPVDFLLTYKWWLKHYFWIIFLPGYNNQAPFSTSYTPRVSETRAYGYFFIFESWSLLTHNKFGRKIFIARGPGGVNKVNGKDISCFVKQISDNL